MIFPKKRNPLKNVAYPKKLTTLKITPPENVIPPNNVTI